MIYNYYAHITSPDYIYIIDDNLTLQKDETFKFKLVNFSIMNSMLNVSSNHGNNIFKIRLEGVNYNITIPDGSYTPISLRDKINEIANANIYGFVLNYDKLVNKYYITTAEGLATGDFIFYPSNASQLLGFTKSSYDMPTGNYYGETFCNMLSYSKVCLTSRTLVFNDTTNNNLEVKYKNNTGINEIICWINRDTAPFTTISYTNTEDTIFEIASTNLKSINFQLVNEYKQMIIDAPSYFVQFQIHIENNTKWHEKFYKLLNDMYYSLVSLYFK